MNQKEFSEKALRHGEISLLPIDSLPKGAKQTEVLSEFVLGHSESGHNHVLTASKTGLFKIFEFEGKTYLDIPLEAKLSHQKIGEETHGTVAVKPGIYERVIKKSYSYALKLMRRVQD